MPLRTIRCRQVRANNGRVYARFSDKVELEFESRQAMRRWIAEQLSENTLKAILLAKVLEDAGDGTPLSQCDGLRATLDWAATPILKVEVSA